ncbi:uncharacterized protein LOC135945035 isoform X2 [Cloeon dipterum]|uniref:uncharacterized protein LOC135945035 isoform X2 n=1 Tax=Cloeon dipterum TaxID=197152 RepID=UPI00321F85FB
MSAKNSMDSTKKTDPSGFKSVLKLPPARERFVEVPISGNPKCSRETPPPSFEEAIAMPSVPPPALQPTAPPEDVLDDDDDESQDSDSSEKRAKETVVGILAFWLILIALVMLSNLF